MGNHHSQGGPHTEVPTAPHTATTIVHSGSKKEKALSRTASGTDIQDKFSTQLLPIEKLAKILLKRSQVEDHVQGITAGAFSRYVFPRYPALADKLFHHLHRQSGAKTEHLGCTAFRQQCERFLGIMDDETVLNMYVKMYSEHDDGGDMMTTDSLRLLLLTAYRVAMDHYSEGPQMCLHIQRTLTAVVDSCFHGKTRLSAQFVAHWLQANCPRLILPLHRYAVHSLATAHRALDADGAPLAQGIELVTPVLEQPPPFGTPAKSSSHLLPMSSAWLLAGALPPVYSRPRAASMSPTNPGACLSGQMFLAKLVSAVPSHWIALYNSDIHGQGANRFLHHVLAYRGPTIVLLKADCGSVFCIASTLEWHETHLYWGGEDSAVLQLCPKFHVIERGDKMLYLNTTIRGYPQGLRAGKDPRKPVIIVDGGFEKIEYRNIPYTLTTIEVWGCGDFTQRETQLDIKKWQVKEAERQRNVKLSASDWLDHPDRYLLELAGRPQYNNHGGSTSTNSSHSHHPVSCSGTNNTTARHQ
ncbi:uncharacterized protein CBL_02173 [Carabus blaptoides fortunei]